MDIEAANGKSVDLGTLGSETIEKVLQKMAEIDSTRKKPQQPIVQLRQSMAAAYRALLLCDGDENGMLRKRLDLLLGFAYPSLAANIPATVFAKSLGESLLDGAPLRLWRVLSNSSDAKSPVPIFAQPMLAVLSKILRRDLRSIDSDELYQYKVELDSWIDQIIGRSLKQIDLSTAGLKDFQRFAKAIRDADPVPSAKSHRETSEGDASGNRLRSFVGQIDMDTDPEDTFRRLRKLIEGVADEVDSAKADIDSAKEDVLIAREATLEASGQTGEVALGAHFHRAAIRDEMTATILSVVSVLALVAAFALGYQLLGDLSDIDFATEVAKLALTLPILAVAAYMGRLSGHYREAARWAKSASTQLMSLNAFAQGLSTDDHRDELKLILGRRVFGDPGIGAPAKNPDVEDVTAIIDSVGNAVRSKE